MNKKTRTIILGGILIIFLLLVWYYPLVQSITKPYISRLVIKDNPTISDNSIYYPSLGISAPINPKHDLNPFSKRDWPIIRQDLTKGVDLLQEKPSYGTNFNSNNLIYVIGHSTDYYPHEYSSIFASLGQAKVGDSFYIALEGEQYQYNVTDKKIISPTSTQEFLNLSPGNPKIQRAALVTCWPLFTSNKRLVVIGERNI